MEFEYDRIKMCVAMKLEFIYFFHSSIELVPIDAGRENT